MSDALHARVRAFIDAHASGRADPSAESFEQIALDIARFQADRVPAVRRLFAHRGVDPRSIARVEDVPAVPSDVFRFTRVAAHARSEDAVVFQTSGTTSGARGEHALRTTVTYDHGALAWGRAMLFPDRDDMTVVVLAPPPEEAPGSSLGHMIDLFARAQRGPRTWHLRGGALDVEGVVAACENATKQGQPVLLFGTSFAFVFLLDAWGGWDQARAALPLGSRAMITGGFKGRSREVAADDLRRAIATAFGLPSRAIVGEYGMTELSSQLYEATWIDPEAAHGIFVAPPWLRVTPVDPSTLTPVARGEPGIARFVDLANVDSAIAVQTADVIREVEARSGPAIALFGRMPGATPRGCSLAVEEALGNAPPGEATP